VLFALLSLMLLAANLDTAARIRAGRSPTWWSAWYEWRQGVKEISPTTLEGYRRQIDQRRARAPRGPLRSPRAALVVLEHESMGVAGNPWPAV
jgi:hypothetical protein